MQTACPSPQPTASPRRSMLRPRVIERRPPKRLSLSQRHAMQSPVEIPHGDYRQTRTLSRQRTQANLARERRGSHPGSANIKKSRTAIRAPRDAAHFRAGNRPALSRRPAVGIFLPGFGGAGCPIETNAASQTLSAPASQGRLLPCPRSTVHSFVASARATGRRVFRTTHRDPPDRSQALHPIVLQEFDKIVAVTCHCVNSLRRRLDAPGQMLS